MNWTKKLHIVFPSGGYRPLIVVSALLVVISFAAAFSTSSNMVNIYQRHDHFFYLFKHTLLILIALIIFFISTNIDIRHYKKYAFYMLVISIILLIYTFFFGVDPNGSGARRWIRIPFATIQPSLIALPVFMLYTTVFLDKIKDKKHDLQYDFKHFWIYFFIVLVLIVPHNFSTGFILGAMSIVILFIGGYPFKRLLLIGTVIIGLGGVYFLAAKAFPQTVPNRFETLINRLERYSKGEEVLQTKYAKAAIATGGFFRFAPGKSVQKNLLSQSSSDFVYAILAEEYGIFGALSILFLYLALLMSFIGIASKQETFYPKLLTVALGSPLILQAFLNMAVGSGVIPVTGQPLPLISTGGTTIFMTGWILGVIYRISMKKQSS